MSEVRGHRDTKQRCTKARMNIIYETTKERGATILIPTSMVDSMNPVVALALAGQDTTKQKTNGPLPLSNRSQ